MDMFKPQLTLLRQVDDTYDLRSVTLTPNSCYFAGPARRGLPPGHVVTPETEPVILELRYLSSGGCLPAIKPVEHFLPGLVLGSEVGKTHVAAFVVLDGKVLGISSIGVEEAMSSDAKAAPNTAGGCFPTEDWYAWDDQMPGSPRSLNVHGVVVAPTPGYSVTLEAGASINPGPRLPLILKVKKLPGYWPAVMTRIPATYRQEPYGGQYKTVAIQQGDCEPIVIDIEEVG